jgi:hypothetical protein
VLEIEDNFNISQAVDKTINDTKQEFDEFGNDIVTYLDQYVSKLRHDLGDGFDLADFDLPTFERDFNLSIPAIPESSIRFQFDGMELYMEMETVISAGATYEINLFSSKSPYGFKIKELQLGFVLTIDLILSVDGEVDISSGFHIKLDDGVSMAIPLFGDSVSDIKVYVLSTLAVHSHQYLRIIKLTPHPATAANSSSSPSPSKAQASSSKLPSASASPAASSSRVPIYPQC